MSVLLREAIGGSIRRARTERNRTLRDVSHSARVSLGYLSEIERGRKEPSSELLAAICEALSLPLSDLLDEVADSLRPRNPRPRRPRPVTVLDPALRTAVEEALEGAQDDVDAGTSADAEQSETVPVGGSGDDAEGADEGTGPSASLVEQLPGDGDDDLDESEDGDADDDAPGDEPLTRPVMLVGRGSLASPLEPSLTSGLAMVRLAA